MTKMTAMPIYGTTIKIFTPVPRLVTLYVVYYYFVTCPLTMCVDQQYFMGKGFFFFNDVRMELHVSNVTLVQTVKICRAVYH